jgi:hypothetical protein
METSVRVGMQRLNMMISLVVEWEKVSPTPPYSAFR